MVNREIPDELPDLLGIPQVGQRSHLPRPAVELHQRYPDVGALDVEKQLLRNLPHDGQSVLQVVDILDF